MLDSLETYWLKVFSENDGGGGSEDRAGQGGEVIYAPGIADRRECRRYSYEVVVECRILGPPEDAPTEQHPEFPALTQNVSRSGLAVLSNVPFVPGQTIGLKFTHSDNGTEYYRVCWSKKTREGTYLSGLHRKD